MKWRDHVEIRFASWVLYHHYGVQLSEQKHSVQFNLLESWKDCPRPLQASPSLTEVMHISLDVYF